MADNRKFLDQAGLVKLVKGLNEKYAGIYVAKGEKVAATNITFQSDNMDGVVDVKGALDVLIANVIRQEDQVLNAAANMQEVAAKLDQELLDRAAGDKALDDRLLIVEEMVGAAGGDGVDSIATRLEDLETFVESHDHKPMEDDIDDLQEAVNTLKGAADVEGSVAKAIADHAAEQLAKDQAQDTLIKKKADQESLEEYVEDFETRIAANEAFVAAQPAKDQAQDNRLTALEATVNGEGEDAKSLDEKIADAQQAAKDYADQKDTADKQAQALVDQEQDRRLGVIEAAIGEDGALEARVAANEDAIEVINGTGEGSIKKAVADLVDGAPEALDTLNELAAALRDNANVLDAVETAFDGKLATLQADVDQNEADCDAAIAAEKSRAEGQEAAIRGEFVAADTALENKVNQKIADDIATAIAQEVTDRDAAIKVEADRAKAEEADIRADFAAADAALKTELQAEIDADVKVVADELAKQKDAAQAGTLAAQIKALQDANAEGGANQVAIEAAQSAADKAQGEVDALEEVVGDIAEGKTVAGLIAENAAAAQAAQDAADTAQGEIDALELVVGEAAAGDEPATGLFAAIAAVQADVDQNKSDCDAAIAAEEARAIAAEKANADAITAIKDGAVMDSFADVETEFAKFGALTDDEVTAAINEAFGA